MSDQVPCTQCTFLNIETYLSYESGLGLTKLANHSVRRLVHKVHIEHSEKSTKILKNLLILFDVA